MRLKKKPDHTIKLSHIIRKRLPVKTGLFFTHLREYF